MKSKLGEELNVVEKGGDPFIPTEELCELELESPVEHEGIQIFTEDGWVTLDGELPCCLRKSQLPRDH